MNKYLYSTKEKREQLGWTLKDLAEKTNISYGTLMRIENGITAGMDDYIDWIEITLNKALKIPYKKWSYKYDRCEKCGTTQTEHVSRGLCKYCYNRDIAKRHKDENRIRKYGGSSSILTKEYLLENYVRNKKSLGEIARESNCSREYVYKKMKSYGIEPRDKSSARELALDKDKVSFNRVNDDGINQSITLKKINLNESFFSKWTEEMAYVLGLIYTDGYLNPGRRADSARKSSGYVSLAQKEPELLEKVLALMNCDARLRFSKRRQFGDIVAGEIYSFAISNDQVYEDLVRLGLTPHKSHTITFPHMSEEFVRHFIRGCWDGDGSIYLERGKALRASYISGSYEFVKTLADELYTAGIYQTRYEVEKEKSRQFRLKYPRYKYPLKIQKRKGSNSYYIRIASREALEKLFTYFYKDVDESMYLNRKYKLFKEGLDMR